MSNLLEINIKDTVLDANAKHDDYNFEPAHIKHIQALNKRYEASDLGSLLKANRFSYALLDDKIGATQYVNVKHVDNKLHITVLSNQLAYGIQVTPNQFILYDVNHIGTMDKHAFLAHIYDEMKRVNGVVKTTYGTELEKEPFIKSYQYLYDLTIPTKK